jgi:hypothetical protein
MIDTEERNGSSSKLDMEYEKLMHDIERRRMLMVLGFIIWNLACLSLLFMPLIQLLELESHYPMMFGNVAISFGLLCYYWRRQDPPKNENQ